jgi:hypothetical protein
MAIELEEGKTNFSAAAVAPFAPNRVNSKTLASLTGALVKLLEIKLQSAPSK